MKERDIMILKTQFNSFKVEYSNKDMKEERRKVLITLMQENLKKRCGKDGGFIECLDGKEHSLTSENVEDLYAIDGSLNADACKNELTEAADFARKDADERNQYGPTKTYPKE